MSAVSLSAGQLRHRVRLQKNSGEGTYDASYGAVTDNWTNLSELQASIRTLSGRELEYARQIVGDVTHEITHRYNSLVTIRHRYKLGDRVFAIGHLDNVEQRNVVTKALCMEVLSQ